jgi:hypothetical protein
MGSRAGSGAAAIFGGSGAGLRLAWWDPGRAPGRRRAKWEVGARWAAGRRPELPRRRLELAREGLAVVNTPRSGVWGVEDGDDSWR